MTSEKTLSESTRRAGVRAVPGTANFRELGPDGLVRPGRLWRADGLADLGPAGRDALAALGVRTVVDLRQAIEIAQHPDDLAGLPLDWHHRPLLGGGFDHGSITTLDRLYVRILDERAVAVAAAVEALTAPGALPAVFHCSAGKDRTGIVAALLLSALEVPDESIAADYARTAGLLAGEVEERIRRRAFEAGLDEQMIAVAMDSPAAAMRATLDHLHDRYGGARAYLVSAGLPEPALDRLLDALRPIG